MASKMAEISILELHITPRFVFKTLLNELVSSLSQLDVGIDTNGEKIAILMYGDVTLLSENEQELSQRAHDVRMTSYQRQCDVT